MKIELVEVESLKAWRDFGVDSEARREPVFVVGRKLFGLTPIKIVAPRGMHFAWVKEYYWFSNSGRNVLEIWGRRSKEMEREFAKDGVEKYRLGGRAQLLSTSTVHERYVIEVEGFTKYFLEQIRAFGNFSFSTEPYFDIQAFKERDPGLELIRALQVTADPQKASVAASKLHDVLGQIEGHGEIARGVASCASFSGSTIGTPFGDSIGPETCQNACLTLDIKLSLIEPILWPAFYNPLLISYMAAESGLAKDDARSKALRSFYEHSLRVLREPIMKLERKYPVLLQRMNGDNQGGMA